MGRGRMHFTIFSWRPSACGTTKSSLQLKRFTGSILAHGLSFFERCDKMKLMDHAPFGTEQVFDSCYLHFNYFFGMHACNAVEGLDFVAPQGSVGISFPGKVREVLKPENNLHLSWAAIYRTNRVDILNLTRLRWIAEAERISFQENSQPTP